MDIGNRVLHRAYVLVESEVPAVDAIEDLVTLAQGNVAHLQSARDQADATARAVPYDDPSVLELAGFEPHLLDTATRRREQLGHLLDRAIASFG
ncbi:MAG: hypothetical protein ACR2NL_03855 [Acidimicrobiia bacterium]